jgi:hypothetical protein
MIICGQEFAFSALNANDVERMETAQKHQQEANAAEQERYTAENVSYPGILRSQCRMMMDYLDEVLGEGASERLHLDGGDFGAVLKVCESFKQAIAAEKAAVNGQFSASLETPRNRAERRAAAQKATPGRVVPLSPVVLPAAQPEATAEQVKAALPQAMAFLSTPEGVKMMQYFMTTYKNGAENG